MTVNLEGLVFPKLLPGHRWVVSQALGSLATWDQIEIEIRRDRRFFTYLGFSRSCWLSRARDVLESSGYGAPFSEPLPEEENELWRFFIMKNAERLHDAYVERLRLPIMNQKVKDSVEAWEQELNA